MAVSFQASKFALLPDDDEDLNKKALRNLKNPKTDNAKSKIVKQNQRPKRKTRKINLKPVQFPMTKRAKKLMQIRKILPMVNNLKPGSLMTNKPLMKHLLKTCKKQFLLLKWMLLPRMPKTVKKLLQECQ